MPLEPGEVEHFVCNLTLSVVTETYQIFGISIVPAEMK